MTQHGSQSPSCKSSSPRAKDLLYISWEVKPDVPFYITIYGMGLQPFLSAGRIGLWTRGQGPDLRKNKLKFKANFQNIRNHILKNNINTKNAQKFDNSFDAVY